MNLLHILVGLLMFGVVGLAANWAMNQWTMPSPIRVAVLVVVSILFLLWLVDALGAGDLFMLDIGR